MKVLLLADIHSNYVALQAVLRDTAAEHFDAVLFAGDLVDYGVEAEPCVEWCFQSKAVAIRGNHDHAVAQRIQAKGGSGFRALAAATRPSHWESMSSKCLKYLGRLPVTEFYRDLGPTFFLIHGTPRDPLDEYMAGDPVGWKNRLEGIEADIVIVGHTHVQFDVDANGTRVINPGSVGQPRDGKPGAAYAVLDGDDVEFRRAEYDIDLAVGAVRRAVEDDWIVQLTEAVLRSGGAIGREEMDAISGGAGRSDSEE